MIRIGILGAARIAPHAIVAPVQRRDDAVIVAVAARDPALARRFANAHGIAEVAASYQALLDRGDLDLIYIALPNAAHAEWSIKALDNGHAVLCEKSMAIDASQAATMIAAAECASQPLIEAFHYRYHALMAGLIAALTDGRIGKIRTAEAWFDTEAPPADDVRWQASLGGGTLLDLGCYCVHALRTLLGEPQVTTASIKERHGVDAVVSASLIFDGGIEAHVSTSMVARTRRAGLRLVGDDGLIEVDNFIAPQLGHEVRFVGREIECVSFAGLGTYDAQLEHVIGVVKGVSAPLTGGDDGLANLKVIDAIRRKCLGGSVFEATGTSVAPGPGRPNYSSAPR